MTKIRTYTELSQLLTFKERFNYLKLNGIVGVETFGFDRYLNQIFYQSKRWREVRNFVIIRDNGCDLGVDGFEIHSGIIIHHMNPITLQDIETESEFLIDPEYLISTVHNTHNAIHYGNENMLYTEPIVRTRFDTCPWKR